MNTEDLILDTLFQLTPAIADDDDTEELCDVAPYGQPEQTKPLTLDDRLERLQMARHHAMEVVEKLEEEASALLDVALAEGQESIGHALVDELFYCKDLSEMLDKVFERVQLLTAKKN